MGPGRAERDHPGEVSPVCDDPVCDDPVCDDPVCDDPVCDDPVAETGEPEHLAAPVPVGKIETVLEGRERRRAEVAAELPAEVEHRPEEAYRSEEDYEGGPAGSGHRESWRRRSAVGALLTGIAFGLGEVLEAERKEPAIIQETSGVPPRDLPVEADLGEASPKRSVVHIRPWLLGEAVPAGSGSAGTTVRGAGTTGPAADNPAGTQTSAGPPPATGARGTAEHPPPALQQTPTAITRVPARAPVRRRLGRRR